MADKTILLVRHGQLDNDAPPHPLGPPLSPVGREQARLTGEWLAAWPVSALFYSPMRRAAETAAIFSGVLPDVPATPIAALGENVPAIPLGFESHFTEFSAEQIGKWKRLADDAFARYFRPGEGERCEVLVTHGNLIRYFVCLVLHAPAYAWGHMEMFNCGVTEIRVASDGACKLVAHNQVGHLPPHLHTARASSSPLSPPD